MRVAIVSHVWDPLVSTPAALLDRFTTLTGWADALHRTGDAQVSVFQRFRLDAQIERSGVLYVFRADENPARPGPASRRATRLHAAVAAACPDLVHINGFEHPLLIRGLRRALPPMCAIVVQDHGGLDPLRISPLRRRWLRHGLASVDAFLAASPGHIAAYRESSLLPRTVAASDVMESSTTLAPMSAEDARSMTGITGDPALLWVGRLNTNKDPLAVLRGVELFAREYPNVRLWLVHQRPRRVDALDLESEVRRAIEAMPALASRAHLIGEVPHDDLAAHYSAADMFVLGSHHEGSGYAAIEALACGATPILTDIPSFRVLTDGGRVGALWAVGDPRSLSDALARVMRREGQDRRADARALFEERFSWNAIGARALRIYVEVSSAKGCGRPPERANGVTRPAPARPRTDR